MGGIKADQDQAKAYSEMTKRVTPNAPLFKNIVLAFLVGGTICTIGQGVLNLFVAFGFSPEEAVTPTLGVMIALGVSLTAGGIYDEIGRFGGMGSALPITGFANSIAAPALEYKREGFVLGVGAKMFTVAGPVLVYGTITAIIVAALRWLLVGIS
ncbi:MAG: stage V sporulation protein AC [Bacillota bacterium]